MFTRQGLAVVASDRAGADAGAQPGKALAVGPVIELAQVQMLVLNQAKPQAVGPLALGAGTGVHQARACRGGR